jgi:thiol-disulfide isomerase/thioredoxin
MIVLAFALGCDAPPAPPAKAAAESSGCRVTGRIVSAEYEKLNGGGIARAIISAWTQPEPERVAQVDSEGERFALRLPPGKYRIDFSAVGTRGATFDGASQQIEIAADQPELDLGVVDLGISRTTSLYGRMAPELTGIIAWQDTPPLTLGDLRGSVVVLDFFAYYCTICHAQKPDLARLREKYEPQGLVVLAVHDNSLSSLAAVDEKMRPVLRKILGPDHRPIPIALDGEDEKSVFAAYGIHAVPAVILIDPSGRVVRRYHHAGDPELEEDIRRLLRPAR